MSSNSCSNPSISLSLSNSNSNLMPCAYFNHGGGPLPILGHQPNVASTFTSYSSTISKPKAIVIITAHWICDTITISNGQYHSLYYDYGGFPSESYQYQYNAPGSPELANNISDLLSAADIPSKKDSKRGWDHGKIIIIIIVIILYLFYLFI